MLVRTSSRITLVTPEEVCTNKLIIGSLEGQKGGMMKGDIEHPGGKFTSNGMLVDEYDPGGMKRGDERTVGTK